MQTFGLTIALIGLGITLWGRWLKTYSPFQQHLFLWGAALLAVSAVLDYEPVLIVFETIIVLGCVLGLFTFPNRYKMIAIALATVVGVLLLVIISSEWTGVLILGLVGLVMGATGFATRSPTIQIYSSIVLIIYNTLQFSNGIQVSAVFALLNLIFGILAVRAMTTKSTSYNSKTPSSPSGRIR